MEPRATARFQSNRRCAASAEQTVRAGTRQRKTRGHAPLYEPTRRKGRGGGKQQSYVTEERINSAVAAALKAASSSDSASEAPPKSEASSTAPSSSSAPSSKQSCCVANYDDTAELEALLNSTSLGADLEAFFSDQSVCTPTDLMVCSSSLKLVDFLTPASSVRTNSCARANYNKHCPCVLTLF